jgi:hypothetical protein
MKRRPRALVKRGASGQLVSREMEHAAEDTKPSFLQAFEELEDLCTRSCPHQLDELLLVALYASRAALTAR